MSDPDLDKVRERALAAVRRVYGDGARVDVERSGTGGMLRVVDAAGKRLNGWYWDEMSPSQKTEDQAWHTLRWIAEDDERDGKYRPNPPSTAKPSV